jgi:hypothetical protein
LGIDNEKCLL